LGIGARILVAAGLIIAASGGWAAAAPFSDIVVFGDSLSDVGNIYTMSSWVYPFTGTLVPDAPYVGGRFTNGPVWVDYVGAVLGLDASTPSLQGGTNYAYGGANTDSRNQKLEDILGVFSFLGHKGVSTQVVDYATEHPNPSGDALHVVWAGGNDFIDGRTDAWQSALNTAINIAILHEYTNARHFLVPNLPPLGLVPRYVGTASSQPLTDLAATYNTHLETMLDFLEGFWPDMDVYRVDVFDTYHALVDNPALFGLTNVTDPAYDEGAGTIVPDPDAYLFWDDLHPSARGHQLLAIAAATALPPGSFSPEAMSALMSAVPEPATVCLLAFGAMLLRRRRRF
jgi:outer membrane lipase/esterase